MLGLGHGNRFVGGHLHTIGNRCWCGYLAVPVRFHERDSRGKVTVDGGEQYLAWLGSDEKPDYVNPPVMAEIRTGTIKRTVRTEKGVMPVAEHDVRPQGLNSAGGGRGKGRPKKWGSEAERLKAYRRRHG